MNAESTQEPAVAERSPAGVARADGQAGGAERAQDGSVAFKFGGSSLAGAERMLHAAGLVRSASEKARVTVIVSAMRGVTNRLLSIAQALADGARPLARAEAEFILHLHREVLRELRLEGDEAARARREIEELGRDLLHDVPRRGRVAAENELPELFDRLASYGERFSARLFAAALTKIGVPAVPVASSDFVVTCDTFRAAKPDLSKTKQRGREVLLPLLGAGIVPVVTGFIGAAPDGRITTLGRNSSDYSGAILAHIVDADELVIWTDVDGIFTANPKKTAEARLLTELTYEEARALAANGAKVLHPDVLPLAAETQTIVWVRNTMNAEARGTRIGPALQGGGAT